MIAHWKIIQLHYPSILTHPIQVTMWTTVIPKIALCFLLLAANVHAKPYHLHKGDPFAICLKQGTNSIAPDAKLSCDAGSVPAFFQALKKISQGVELQFQSTPDHGSHDYNLQVRCPAGQTITQTVTVHGSASTVTSTSTSTSANTITSTTTSITTSTLTEKDCTITPGPTPTPDNDSHCTTGNAACVDIKNDFSSRMGCDEGYQAKGCVCYDSENKKYHHPRCDSPGEVVCTGCN